MNRQVNTWSTDNLIKRDRYEAWSCMLNQAYGRWSSDKPYQPDFFGAVTYFDDDIFKVIECKCDPCGATRSRSEIRSDGLETLTVQVVVDGQEVVMINNETILLNPNDILIWDSVSPMSFQVLDRLHKISIVMPLQRFQFWLPRSWYSIRHSIEGCSGSGLLLKDHVQSLCHSVFDGGCKDDYALIDATMGLLVNALGMHATHDNDALWMEQLHRIKAYIAANIRSPELSPSSIAESNGISTRYLHWLFHQADETVMQYIVRLRLDFCARDLSNLKMARRRISDIAYFWGFQDTAHFNKRFKQQYNMSPTAFRESITNDADHGLLRN